MGTSDGSWAVHANMITFSTDGGNHYEYYWPECDCEEDSKNTPGDKFGDMVNGEFEIV
jgi:hypothetical protein